MKTLAEIKAELIAENPSKVYYLNDEEFVQTEEEFNAAIDKKAQMLFEQQEFVAAKEAERQIKISAYQKLGLTEAEIEVLLPAPTE